MANKWSAMGAAAWASWLRPEGEYPWPGTRLAARLVGETQTVLTNAPVPDFAYLCRTVTFTGTYYYTDSRFKADADANFPYGFSVLDNED